MITPNIRDKNSVYYEGNLNKHGKAVLEGFDNAIMNTDNFFCNLDGYKEVLLENTSLTGSDINYDLFCDKTIEEYPEEELSKLSDNTKILLTLKMCLLDWLEKERNTLGVGLATVNAKLIKS